MRRGTIVLSNEHVASSDVSVDDVFLIVFMSDVYHINMNKCNVCMCGDKVVGYST